MMSLKEKITTKDNITEVARQAGLILMTAAATLGMVELPDHLNSKIVVGQPASFMAIEQQGNNPIRREKEESPQHYISYSIAQRTPGRYGKI